MKYVKIQAPAKINIHLEVGGLRNDGFHELLSLFQGINLYDDMEVFLQGKEGDCLITGDFPCMTRDNLIYKAVKLFRAFSGDQRGLVFRVIKRIPSQAGLGGGSSDGAAALKALALLFDKFPGRKELYKMAETLGSDVPFFMGKSATALVRGRGEHVEEMTMPSSVKGIYGLLVMGEGPGISTKQAFARIDRFSPKSGTSGFTLCEGELRRAWQEDAPSLWPFFNSFMETLGNMHTGLETISDFLYTMGAGFVGLSGSGSALFGLFASEGDVFTARENLKKKGYPFVKSFQFIQEVPVASVV